MKKQVAVVIPYYRNELSETERMAYRQCIKVLSGYPIILIVPDSIKVSKAVLVPGIKTVKVPSKWMQSIETYNQMMLNADFYRMFLEYEYILVYQLDAFVFRDELKKFCELGYDYIGAPWLFGAEYFKEKGNCRGHVGNGGFSLRNVEASIRVIIKNPVGKRDMPEDVYWSSHDSGEFCVAPKEVALRFSIEEPAEKMFCLNKRRLPFGCHAWNRISFSFWRPIIEKHGYKFLDEGSDFYKQPCVKDFRSIWELSCDDIKAGLQKMALRKEDIYVWGAGEVGKGWVIALQCAEVSVRCVDSDEMRWGECFWNVCIESPDILKSAKKGTVLFIAVKKYENEVREQISDMKVSDRLRIFFYEEVLEKFLE